MQAMLEGEGGGERQDFGKEQTFKNLFNKIIEGKRMRCRVNTNINIREYSKCNKYFIIFYYKMIAFVLWHGQPQCTSKFPSRVNLSGTTQGRIGLAGATRLTRSDFRLKLL